MTIPADQGPKLIAHRGVHQIYAGKDRNADTCTANPILPPSHTFIANTVPSIEAAIGYGADLVEIDVHLTTDDVFAVFHDWTLDCQTDGTGVTHKHDFASLKSRDLGFGYTSDGVTFPLRGKGVGLMPSLAELQSAGLTDQLFVNFKSNRAEEGAHFADVMNDTPGHLRPFGVYGGQEPVEAALANIQDLRGFDRVALKSCLGRYALIGWTGIVPASCKDRIIAVPMDYAPFLWGWPHKFTARMNNSGTDVILWGPYDGSGFSSGIDDAATLARVPEQFNVYIWTNRIEIIGPLLHAN